jgi:FKBP-type peptidyl-prolyl cis-trans isomerase
VGLPKRIIRAFGALAASAVLAAGCGSSGSSSSIGVGKENPNAASEAARSVGTSSSAGAETTGTTPTSGPLSTQPKVTPPSGPAPSKLVVKDLIKGTGAEAKKGDTVTVNYVGVLYHGGKEFDASWKRHEPATFPLEEGKLIAGWVQGIPGMRVGGRRELIVPAELGYGAQGSPPTIPPNAALIFVVDLLST